jgi:peptidoglycan/LPS O-acetylase OafA/YrhL
MHAMTAPVLAVPDAVGAAITVIQPSHNRRRITYLDGWRGISILLVLLGHFFWVPGIHLGTLGVEFFFVLSGRLMAEILFIERFPLKEFFFRRVSRIYPALFAFVLISLFAFQHTRVGFHWLPALSAMTFTYNYVGLSLTWSPALQHVWSLCVEEHAYLLLGAIALLARMKAVSVPLITGAVSVLAILDGAISIYYYRQDYFHVYWRTDAHISSILMACCIYLTLRPALESGRLRIPSFAPVVAALVGVALNADVFREPIRFGVAPIFLAFSVATLDYAPPLGLMVLSSRFLVMCGLLSYSLYLWQQPFYGLAPDRWVPTLVMLVAAVICASLSLYLVEQPARRYLNAAFGRRRVRPSSHAHQRESAGETVARFPEAHTNLRDHGLQQQPTSAETMTGRST